MQYINQITISGKDYQVYRNNMGYLELYRSDGVILRTASKVVAKSCDRFVTNVKETEDLVGWFKKKKRRKTYDSYKDSNQLKITT